MFWGQKGCSVKDLTGYFHSSIVLNWKRLLILFPYHYVLSVLYFYEGGRGDRGSVLNAWGWTARQYYGHLCEIFQSTYSDSEPLDCSSYDHLILMIGSLLLECGKYNVKKLKVHGSKYMLNCSCVLSAYWLSGNWSMNFIF